jgi:transposase
VLKTRDQDDKREVLILAQDEGRFGRINRPVRCWAPSPHRPVVGAQIVREYVYMYAAVCPEKGKISALILPYANTDMMSLFLQKVADDFKDYFLVIQVDGAAWHRSSTLSVPENIRLIQQPPYSPELNPVEHVWDDIREKEFANKVFESIESVMDALTVGFKRLSSAPNFLKSMTDFPHLSFIL